MIDDAATKEHFGASDYRSDIDGLRAIAILIVVLFHAHVPGFGGGFVGVDVFFVISGYLIIGLLSREFERTRDLSLVGFFERRVRRLAPALMLVLAVTLVLGAIYLVPVNGEQQALAKSAIATVMLVSNLYFARHTGGYFDAPTEAQPLLHTWSLSVEEQFYLFWPLVVLAAGRYALRRRAEPMLMIRRALLVLFALSLALSLLWTGSNAQTAFFASPTRAWEFAVGGLVLFALREPDSNSRFGGGVAALGLIAIAGAASFLHSDLPFPGYLAALPALGSAAVIFGCASSPRSIVARSLSWRPLVAIGLVSYAWYLWHWPLLAIARVHTLGEIGPPGIAALCLLSLGLAAATYRFVEMPIRRKHVPLMATRRRAYLLGGIGAAFVASIAIGLGVYAKYLWPRHAGEDWMGMALFEMTPVQTVCWQRWPYNGTLFAHPDCDLPRGSRPSIIVWGDSHASHLMPMIERYAEQASTSARIRFLGLCPPLKGYSTDLIGVTLPHGCERFNIDVLSEIRKLRTNGLTTVVLAAHWPAYVEKPEGLQAAEQGLRSTLDALRPLGVRVVVVASVPDFPHEAPACLARRSLQECGLPRVRAEQFRRAAHDIIAHAVGNDALIRIVDPFPFFCSEEFCSPIVDRKILFSDRHHLSTAGSLALLSTFVPVLDWAKSGRSTPSVGRLEN